MGNNNKKLSFNYFDARGRGEIIRLTLAALNMEYTDKRLLREDWPTVKPTTPLGQLPFIESEDFVLPQSLAILHYLAKEGKISGRNNLEEAQVLAILSAVHDARNTFINKVVLAADKEEALKTFYEQDASRLIEALEKSTKLFSKRNGYSVGDIFTVADIGIFDFTTYTPELRAIAENSTILKNIINNVEKNPRIAAYLKGRKQTLW